MNKKQLTSADKIARFQALCKRVDRKKPSDADIQVFREELERVPELWRALGDMCRQAEYHMIEAINVPRSSQESLPVGMDTVRRDLGLPAATPLERMLIEQIALCWLRLSIAELQHADHTMSGSIGISQADYWDRALSATQRRYLRAIESLARVRRLLHPNAVQVNIGAQQVNVANMGKNDAGK